MEKEISTIVEHTLSKFMNTLFININSHNMADERINVYNEYAKRIEAVVCCVSTANFDNISKDMFMC